ncbi:MAG: hypothetical protein LBI63_05580 [Candidatus Ancillula sp.]|jgi:hypothetical protein|nr:hypothetical protein [Candidatus Ancillula sp.]
MADYGINVNVNAEVKGVSELSGAIDKLLQAIMEAAQLVDTVKMELLLLVIHQPAEKQMYVMDMGHGGWVKPSNSTISILAHIYF